MLMVTATFLILSPAPRQKKEAVIFRCIKNDDDDDGKEKYILSLARAVGVFSNDNKLL